MGFTTNKYLLIILVYMRHTDDLQNNKFLIAKSNADEYWVKEEVC